MDNHMTRFVTVLALSGSICRGLSLNKFGAKPRLKVAKDCSKAMLGGGSGGTPL